MEDGSLLHLVFAKLRQPSAAVCMHAAVLYLSQAAVICLPLTTL